MAGQARGDGLLPRFLRCLLYWPHPVLLVRGEERIEGFASLMPMAPGLPPWTSCASARTRRAAPWTVFRFFIEWAKDNGYTHVNLGMAPMSNTGTTRFSRAREKVVRVIYDFGDRLYNFKGLRSYKEKFKPRWRSRYLAYTGTTALTPLSWAFSMLFSIRIAAAGQFRCSGASPRLARVRATTPQLPFRQLTLRLPRALERKVPDGKAALDA